MLNFSIYGYMRIKELFNLFNTYDNVLDLINHFKPSDSVIEKIKNNTYTDKELLALLEDNRVDNAIDIASLYNKNKKDKILEAITQSERGKIFEAMFSLCIQFGVSPFGKDITFYRGNVNRNEFFEINDIRDILNSFVNSGNSGGYSDITFSKDGCIYLSSSKYYLNDSKKSLNDYEIHKLHAISNNNRDKNFKYLLFLKDKKAFFNTWESANDSTKQPELNWFNPIESCFDLNDLQNWYESFRDLLNLYNFDYEKINYLWFVSKRQVLKPMYHQKLAFDKINTHLQNGGNSYLLAHKPRAGKTVTTAYYCLKKSPKNILLLSNLPCLNTQWKDTFEMFLGLEKYNIIDVSNTKPREIELEDYNFVLVSLQDIKDYEKAKFNNIRNITWDLLIIDEVHLGKETIKTDDILQKINFNFLLGLSATPTKNLIRGTFTRDNTHYWGIVEEKEMKDKEISEKINGVYTHYPNMNFYMYSDFHKDFTHYEFDEQFTFTKFFEVENDKFKYEADIKRFIKWLRGGYGNNNTAPFNLFDIKSSLIFVPQTKHQELLLKIFEEDSWFKDNYDVHITNSKINDSNRLMVKVNDEFVSKSEKGKIIIAVDQLRTGVTLKQCDTVIFMNDIQSMDNYIQASFRCQSPMKGKSDCRVIDFLPTRLFTILNDFVLTKQYVSNDSKSKIIHDFLKCMNIFHENNGKLVAIDFEEFRRKVVDTLHLGYTIFPSYVFDIESITKNIYIDDMFDVEKKSTFIKVFIHDDSVKPKNSTQIGRTVSATVNEKSVDVLVQEIKNKLSFILNRLLFLQIVSEFKHNTVSDLFNSLDNYTEKEILNHLKSDVTLKDVEMVLDMCCDINLVNDRLQLFNEKISLLLASNDVNVRINVLDIINKYINNTEVEKKIGDFYTPKSYIENAVDKLPKNVFENPNYRWLDPTAGAFNFYSVIIPKLMFSLRKIIPDEKQRYYHITTNMLYGYDYSLKNIRLAKMIFGNHINLSHTDFLNSTIEKFDIVVIHPPHNKINDGTKPAYPDFIIKAFQFAPVRLCIIPSKWLRKESLGDFRHYLKNRNLVSIETKRIRDALKLSLQGDMSIIYSDANYDGLTQLNGENIDINQYDIIHNFTSIERSIVNKVIKFDNLDSNFRNANHYRVPTNYLCKEIGDYKCHTSLHKTDKCFVDDDELKVKADIDKWKVITPEARGEHKTIGRVFIGLPMEICNSSFVFFSLDSEKEANNLKSFLESNIGKWLVSLRKSSHHISMDAFKWIPNISKDMSVDSVYKKLKLTKKEISYLESLRF